MNEAKRNEESGAGEAGGLAVFDGWKKIDVFVRDYDYELLLAAQAAIRVANERPTPEAKAEASKLLRDVQAFAPSTLCAAAEQHHKGEAR